MVRLRLQRNERTKAIDTGMRAPVRRRRERATGVSWQVATTLDPVARLNSAIPKRHSGCGKRPGRRSRTRGRRLSAPWQPPISRSTSCWRPTEAGALLEMADAQFKDGNDVDAANLHRVWGDWHARRGDAAAALAAYQQAAREASPGPERRSTECAARCVQPIRRSIPAR